MRDMLPAGGQDATSEDDRPLCPVCGTPMYAVQVAQHIYALPCFHWLYQGGGDDLTAMRRGKLTFEALMDDALHCPCDQADVPLCVHCECLFLLAAAATNYAYMHAQRRRHVPAYAEDTRKQGAPC